MILGAEIALTIMGLLALIRGKGLGKETVPHPHYRWLGAFCMTVLPAAFAAVFCFVAVYAIMHADLSEQAIEERLRWPVVGIEGGVVLLYVAVATLWERSIKKRAARAARPASA